MATHSRTLKVEKPMDGGAWEVAETTGLQRVRLNGLTSLDSLHILPTWLAYMPGPTFF